jgi:hypothetical protein
MIGSMPLASDVANPAWSWRHLFRFLNYWLPKQVVAYINHGVSDNFAASLMKMSLFGEFVFTLEKFVMTICRTRILETVFQSIGAYPGRLSQSGMEIDVWSMHANLTSPGRENEE